MLKNHPVRAVDFVVEVDDVVVVIVVGTNDDDDDDDDVVSLFSSTRRELEERNCSRHAELYNLSESCLKVVRLGFKSLPNPFLKPSFKIEVLSTTYYIRTHANPSQTTRIV